MKKGSYYFSLLNQEEQLEFKKAIKKQGNNFDIVLEHEYESFYSFIWYNVLKLTIYADCYRYWYHIANSNRVLKSEIKYKKSMSLLIKMLLFLLTGTLLFLLSSCESRPFTGYVVGKTYTAGHMCCSNPKVIVTATPVRVPPHPVHTHHHVYEKATFEIHVANRYDVETFYVDSLKFNSIKMLEKITFY